MNPRRRRQTRELSVNEEQESTELVVSEVETTPEKTVEVSNPEPTPHVNPEPVLRKPERTKQRNVPRFTKLAR
jgi:hypothetical protein